MAGKLQGKVAIVTGAGQGLGFGMAHAYADEGAKVVITGRVKEKLEAKAEIIRAGGGEVITFVGNVGKRSDVKAMVAQTLEAFGKIDILVNNAQTMVPEKPLDEVTDEMFEASVQSGLFGTFYSMQEAFPALRVQGGSIINYGSMMAVLGTIGCGAYAANKEGIRGLTRVAARDWGKYNIRVNLICPGAASEALVGYFEKFPDKMAQYAEKLALGKFADPYKDIGQLCVFLGGDDCFLTGQTLYCDGGQMMHS